MSDVDNLHEYLKRHPRLPSPGLVPGLVTPAVVIGLCKHGLYLTRNFARHGVPVIAIASDLSPPSARTRYGHKIRCDDINGLPLIATLNSLKQHVPLGTPIFPTNDKIVDTLLAHYEALSSHFRLPFPNSDLVTRLKDKVVLDQLATQGGLPVPQSHSIRSLEDLARHQEAILFPVAVKPTLPMSSFKSRRCETFGELKAQVETSAALGEPLIVQEWIDGDDRAIMFGAYYIGRDGACLTEYAGRKLMSYPPVTGHAAATESSDIGYRLAEGLKFLQDTGYWGLCSIEYKGMSPERAKFIEVTVGRCDWWIMCCGINGVDIPMAAYNDLAEARIPFSNSQTSQFVWHDIDHSLPVLIENVISGRWSLREALIFLMRPKKDSVFDLHDICPFLCSLGYYFVRVLTKSVSVLIKPIKNLLGKSKISQDFC